MNGLINQIHYNISDPVEELNSRLNDRNIPSNTLHPQFSMRPVSTKYTMLPIVDRHTPSSVTINKQTPYNVGNTFNPGSASPWSGFSTNIDKESILRNQPFALQKSIKSVYIPSSTSDMYKVTVSGRNEIQPFTDLFKEQIFEDFNPNSLNVGNNVFNNSTREQMLG